MALQLKACALAEDWSSDSSTHVGKLEKKMPEQ